MSPLSEMIATTVACGGAEEFCLLEFFRALMGPGGVMRGMKERAADGGLLRVGKTKFIDNLVEGILGLCGAKDYRSIQST
jgi:hypothetical protein